MWLERPIYSLTCFLVAGRYLHILFFSRSIVWFAFLVCSCLAKTVAVGLLLYLHGFPSSTPFGQTYYLFSFSVSFFLEKYILIFLFYFCKINPSAVVNSP